MPPAPPTGPPGTSPDGVGTPASVLPTAPRLVSRCPGCGSVLAAVEGIEARHAGASPACTRLFDVTVRGLRDEAPSDGRAAAVLELATAAYDAQHGTGDGGDALGRLSDALGGTATGSHPAPPGRWTTTVADVAADLDVVDLAVLIRSWARAVAVDRADGRAVEG